MPKSIQNRCLCEETQEWREVGASADVEFDPKEDETYGLGHGGIAVAGGGGGSSGGSSGSGSLGLQKHKLYELRQRVY